MTDSLQHQGLRKKMVATLRTKGITNEAVLAAMAKIPRHFFIDSGFASHAYEDKPFSIAAGQTISQPFTVAYQTQLLDVKKSDKILEIGTGSGYQTAVLAELCANVYTIERQRKLFGKAKNILLQLHYNANFFLGDGYEGKPIFAPFDKIIVTAGAAEIPQKLLAQLAVGGRMIIPVGNAEKQQMLAIDRVDEKKFTSHKYGDFSFVPMLKGIE